MDTLKHLAFWVVPSLILNSIELIVYDYDSYLIRNLIENFNIGLVLWLVVEVFKTKVKLIWIVLLLFVHLSCIALESFYYFTFKTFINASAIYILLETNQSEAQEFMNTYFNYKLALTFLGILILLLVYRKLIVKNKTSYFSNHRSFTLLFCIIVLLSLKFSGFIVPNFSYITARSFVNYYIESQKYLDLEIDKSTSANYEVSSLLKDEPQTYVLVIGESTTKSALGLYGSGRNTTPRLNDLSSELLVYDDVVSPHAHTIDALRKSLTLNHLQDSIDISIVQLMNQAGFKTFWLSNQRPVGLHETLLTKISLASSEVIYTNSAKWGDKTPFDEVLLPHLDRALNDPAEKKFIVLNFLATHNEYHKRYPPEFNTFSLQPETKFPSQEAFQKINTYHNAITYVDYLLDQIISKVKLKNTLSYVLYFSDHGDEVFREENFVGHNDSYKATAAMFEIPFFLWQSKHYKQMSVLDYDTSRPYVMNDFMHSFIDISQLKFNNYNPHKSIFSKEFKPQKERIVGKSINYDRNLKN